MRKALLLAVSLLVLGCGARQAKPSAANASTTAWASKIEREHPLVGKIWDAEHGAFVDESAVVARLAAAPYVLLGEKHDNPDHHAVQARLLDAIVKTGKKPALAFEMITLDRQDDVDAARNASPTDPDAIGRALDWPKSGWPSWGYYRPLFATALAAGLPIEAANLPTRVVRGIAAHGLDVLDPRVRADLGLDAEMPPPLRASLEEELRATHCGQLPERMIPTMADAQRARDASMAARLASNDPAKGAVLIAGNGHVRTDRGVPMWLAAHRPDAAIVAIGVLEVDRGSTDPRDYAAAMGAKSLPFTFVYFTPRESDEDPCRAFEQRPPTQSASL